MTAQRDFSLIMGYGSDMGTAEAAARAFAKKLAGSLGIEVEPIELNDVELADLRTATHFIAVTSTFGHGEFPGNAAVFWEALSATTADRLDDLSFAVLAFGDSGHELFCNAGRLLDERLEALGATRVAARVDVDGPCTEPAETWTSDVVRLLGAAPIHA